MTYNFQQHMAQIEQVTGDVIDSENTLANIDEITKAVCEDAEYASLIVTGENDMTNCWSPDFRSWMRVVDGNIAELIVTLGVGNTYTKPVNLVFAVVDIAGHGYPKAYTI